MFLIHQPIQVSESTIPVDKILIGEHLKATTTLLEFLPDNFIGDATITFYDPAVAKLASTWSNGKDVNGCKIKVQMAPVSGAPKANIQTTSFPASRGKYTILLGSSIF